MHQGGRDDRTEAIACNDARHHALLAALLATHLVEPEVDLLLLEGVEHIHQQGVAVVILLVAAEDLLALQRVWHDLCRRLAAAAAAEAATKDADAAEAAATDEAEAARLEAEK